MTVLDQIFLQLIQLPYGDPRSEPVLVNVFPLYLPCYSSFNVDTITWKCSLHTGLSFL